LSKNRDIHEEKWLTVVKNRRKSQQLIKVAKGMHRRENYSRGDFNVTPTTQMRLFDFQDGGCPPFWIFQSYKFSLVKVSILHHGESV